MATATLAEFNTTGTGPNDVQFLFDYNQANMRARQLTVVNNSQYRVHVDYLRPDSSMLHADFEPHTSTSVPLNGDQVTVTVDGTGWVTELLVAGAEPQFDIGLRAAV